MNDKLRRVWVDPVWSKVIAAAIIGAGTSILAFLVALVINIPFGDIWVKLITAVVTVPLWPIILLIITLGLLLLHAYKIWPFSRGILKPSVSDSNPSEEDKQEIFKLLNADPNEHAFFSIQSIIAMNGDERERRLRKFLSGRWKLSTRKKSVCNEYEINVYEASNEILIRRAKSDTELSNDIHISNIEFDTKTLTVRYTLYRPYDQANLGKEFVTIENDELMAGMNETHGYIVSYIRDGLFKAIRTP